MLDIESALASLNLNRAKSQQVMCAFITLLNSIIPATPTSSPSTTPSSSLLATSGSATLASSTSYEMLDLGGYSTGDEDVNDSNDEVKPPIANAGSARCAVVASTTAVADDQEIVIVAAPAAASTEVVTASVAVNGTTTTTTATASVAAAVVAPAAPAAAVGPAVPLYSQLPLNAPSNAILLPPHLVTIGNGYHVPGHNDNPPFYVVTRGRDVGVFSGWFVNFPMMSSFNS